MAEPRTFRKMFGRDFAGINFETSSIEDNGDNTVGAAVNYEWAPSNSIRGRVGSQMAGPAGNFFGTSKHTYPKTQSQYAPFYSTSPSINSTKINPDGSTVNQCVFLSDSLYVLDTIPVEITVILTGGFAIWAQFNDSDSHIHFIIQKDDGPTTVIDFDCGDGISTFHTYYELLQVIHATATFNVNFTRANCPPIAIINGDQITSPSSFTGDNSLSHSFPSLFSHTITVDSGHTFLPGDIIYLGYQRQWQFGYVISKSNTTITFLTAIKALGTESGGSISFLDNEVLGILGSLACAFPISTAINIESGPLIISFPYYRAIGTSPGKFNFQQQKILPTIENGYRPPTFTSLNGVLYFTATQSSKDRNLVSLYPTPLCKYDGQDVYAAGLPTNLGGSSWGFIAGGGTGLTGTFRYRSFFRRYDAQGNIIEGAPTLDIGSSITLSNGSTDITFRNITIDGAFPSLPGAETPGYQSNAAYTAEAKSSFVGGAGNPIKIDNSNGTAGYLQVGDPICFNSTAGVLIRSKVIQINGSVSPMTMSIETIPSTNIADNTPISAGLSTVILRTTTGGTIWYELTEIANDSFNTTTTYSDTISDATLSAGIVFIDPDEGKEHNPPTDCSLVCQHQGGLVVAGGFSAPNTVSFSSADGPEYFPLASNNFDVPSSTNGMVSAIFSDTIDRLAVCKEDSYYDVAGDLDGGQFSVNIVNEGDYGIVSQATVQRIKGYSIGLSKLGFVLIKNGALDDQAFRAFNARLLNQEWLFSAAVATNDAFNRNYICHIPNDNTLTGGSNTFILDYSRSNNSPQSKMYAQYNDPAYATPFTRDYAQYLRPSYSTLFNDALYTLSFEANTYANGLVYRRLYRFQEGESPTGNDGDCYIDHVSPILYAILTQPMNLGEPSVMKNPIRTRIFSVPNNGYLGLNNLIEGWVPFTLAITYIGTPGGAGQNTTLTFSSNTDYAKEFKMIGGKCISIILYLVTNTVRQSPFLSGFEIVIPLPYAKQDIQR